MIEEEAGVHYLQADQQGASPVTPAKKPKSNPVGPSAQPAHCPLSTAWYFTNFANWHQVAPARALINAEIQVKHMIQIFCRYTAYPFCSEIPSIARPRVVTGFPLLDSQSLLSLIWSWWWEVLLWGPFHLLRFLQCQELTVIPNLVCCQRW